MSYEGKYDEKFYLTIEEGSRLSAEAVIDHLSRLFPKVDSAVDFGCGSGLWLAALQRAGVSRVRGYDSGEAAGERLAIDPSCFEAVDLSAKFRVAPSDLAISLEVAEHIPRTSADMFIDNIVASAPRVVFSAALAGQGGNNHINEQMPGYWIAKFAQRGFVCHDVLRPLIWADERIKWWYRQNVLVFLHATLHDEAAQLARLPSFGGRSLIHPEVFERRNKQIRDMKAAAASAAGASPTSEQAA